MKSSLFERFLIAFFIELTHVFRDATIMLFPNRARRASQAGSAGISRVIVRKKNEHSGRRVGDNDTPYRYPRQYYLLAIFQAVGRRDAPTCAYALTPRVGPASLASLPISTRSLLRSLSL